MKKKVIYKTGRNKFEIIEVTTPEEEKTIEVLNRDFERMKKADQRYRARFLSLDELYETSGFEPSVSDSFDEEREMLYQSLHNAMERIKPRYRQAHPHGDAHPYLRGLNTSRKGSDHSVGAFVILKAW